MLDNKIYEYLCYMFDEHAAIPSEDEVYEKFAIHFDNYVSFDEIAIPAVENFASIHDLTEIEIRWEGELNGACEERTSRRFKVSPKTA